MTTACADPAWETAAWRKLVAALDSEDDDARMAFILARAQAADAQDAATIRDRGVEMTGCQARVWVVMERRHDGLWFQGFSESAIVQGLVAVMTEAFSGLGPAALRAVPLDAVRAFSLGAMTTHRQLGMMAMLKHMQKLAAQETAP